MARSTRCPNCNAPLKPDSSQELLHCDYCNVDVANPRYRRAGEAASRGKIGIIVASAVGACVVAGVAGVLAFSSKPAPKKAEAPPARPQPAKKKAPPKKDVPRLDQLIVTRDVDGDGVGDVVFGGCAGTNPDKTSNCYVGLIGGKQGKLVWQKAYLSHWRTRGRRLLCGGALVVQDNTRSLVAFEVKNGAQRWRLTLSDFLRNGSREAGKASAPVCLFFTEDRALSVVNPKVGKLLWRQEIKSPRGIHDQKVGEDTLYLDRMGKAVDMLSGKERALPFLKPGSRRSLLGARSLFLAGPYAYHRPRASKKASVYRAADSKKIGNIPLSPKERLNFYSVGERALAMDAFRPPVQLKIFEGVKQVGAATLPEGQGVSQMRHADGALLFKTVNLIGTRETSLHVFDMALKKRWSVQLDASGKGFAFVGRGPNFGGFASRGSGSARIAAGAGLLLVDMGGEKKHRARISARSLESGEVLGELIVPASKRLRAGAAIRWLRAAKGRIFVGFSSPQQSLVAFDSKTRKLLWSYGRR